MPELFNLPSYEMKHNYVSSIKDTILLRDIGARYKVKDIKLLDDLFVYLINTASSLISITNIINFFASKKRKTNYETLEARPLFPSHSSTILRTNYGHGISTFKNDR